MQNHYHKLYVCISAQFLMDFVQTEYLLLTELSLLVRILLNLKSYFYPITLTMYVPFMFQGDLEAKYNGGNVKLFSVLCSVAETDT